MGFLTSYTFVPPASSIDTVAQYVVASDPSKVSIWGWAAIGDHTSGHGLMLIANGSSQAGQEVWSNPIPPDSETTRAFSFCATGVDPAPSGAILQMSVDGTFIGLPLTVSTTPGAWLCTAATWSPGSAQTAQSTLSIVDLNVMADNNDFAIDDIAMSYCPPAGAAH
jgi:hypothetical protein